MPGLVGGKPPYVTYKKTLATKCLNLFMNLSTDNSFNTNNKF